MVLGVQMPLQVLSPLPSPRIPPPQTSEGRFECRCSSSTDSAATDANPSRTPGSDPKPQETTYFPTANTSAHSRRVRFRSAATSTASTQNVALSETMETAVGGPLNETGGVGEHNDKPDNAPTDCSSIAPGEEVKKRPDVVATNHISGVFHPPKRKSSPAPPPQPKPNTDIIVAAASVSMNLPDRQEPRRSLASLMKASSTGNAVSTTTAPRRPSILHRQEKVEEKSGVGGGGGVKIAQERQNRMSLRPTLMLASLRGNQRSADDGSGSTPRKPSLPANGVVRPGGEAVDSGRRFTRFSSFLLSANRLSADLTSATSDPGAEHSDVPVDIASEYSTDHRVVLMEVLCCCAACCDGRGGRGGGGGGRGDVFGAAGRRGRVLRGAGDVRGGRGEYSNLIENHRLARLVTLLAVLAILGLVLTYIIKSIVEQQQHVATGTNRSATN
ncbi:unnamed protein product [Mesocestoides corti]|uniref:Uncharacterized protein n=1 Tax=Mesocestoides corti TaxID=53468 RepID=A0A0R3UJT9_MESCO|nr:unnamed protein product [Mesocestoides corti]